MHAPQIQTISKELQILVTQLYDDLIHNHNKPNPEQKKAISHIISLLNTGKIRAINYTTPNDFTPNLTVKKAIVIFLASCENHTQNTGFTNYADNVPQKYAPHHNNSPLDDGIIRMVPPTSIRYGSYIGPKCIIMPSFINIGAYIGSGTMIDTWATIGSCAQIGKKCHISGGSGVGGVLEPAQATPVIIEDNVFIGARSEIVEGCIIGTGSVIAPGIFLSKSTKIYNRMTNEIIYGKIPPYSVVVPGSLPSKCGKYSLSAAIIAKNVDAKTRSKTCVNELLRIN